MSQCILLYRMFREAKKEHICLLPPGLRFLGNEMRGQTRPLGSELMQTRVGCRRKVGGKEGQKESLEGDGQTLRLKRTEGLKTGKRKPWQKFNPSDVEALGPRNLGKMGLCPLIFSSVFVRSSDQVAASLQTLFYSTLIFLLTIILCSIVLLISCYMSVTQRLSLTYIHKFLLLYYPSLTESGFWYLMPWVFRSLTFPFVDLRPISPVLHSYPIARVTVFGQFHQRFRRDHHFLALGHDAPWPKAAVLTHPTRASQKLLYHTTNLTPICCHFNCDSLPSTKYLGTR